MSQSYYVIYFAKDHFTCIAARISIWTEDNESNL